MLKHQRGDPDVVDGDGRTLPGQLELEVGVEVGREVIAHEDPHTRGVEELEQGGLVLLALDPLREAEPELGQDRYRHFVTPPVPTEEFAPDMVDLVRRIDADTTSYLYATVHLGRMDWIFPGQTVIGALRNADVAALELDVTDPAMAEQFLAAQPPLPRALAPALERRLSRQFDVACVAQASLVALHPVMQAVTLMGMAARRDGLDPSFGQEYVLAAVARELRQPVIALETVALQMRALIPSVMDEIEHLMDQMLLDLEQDRVRKPLVRLAAAWENGLLHEFENYERWCECARTESERAFLRRLNDERNPMLAQRIGALHDGGRKVFAAVGALHMTGPLAVQRLLAEQGFRVERVGLTP